MSQTAKWMNPAPTKCNICGRAPQGRFVDGKTCMGPWALMCETCHEAFGVGIGTGKGQKYDTRTLEKIDG